MSTGLVSIPFDMDARADRHRLGREVFACLLTHSLRYDRAVGFFSSSALGVLGEELRAFFERGGRTRLVCSPRLAGSDIAALARAVYSRREARTSWKSVAEAFRSGKWPSVLAYLVAHGLMNVRIALVASGSDRSMYHEKLAVFAAEDDLAVAATGSANESATALSENFERVDLFKSWDSEESKRRVVRLQTQFEDLWNNRTEGLEVIDLPEAFARAEWEETNSDDSGNLTTTPTVARVSVPEAIVVPAALTIRGHQTAAIDAWGKAGGRGILEMATGAGKTITALTAAARVAERLPPGIVIVVIAPLVHLVDQWRDVAGRFGLVPVRCAESSERWLPELEAGVSAVNQGGRPVLSVVVTADALAHPRAQIALSRIRKPLLIVADEVHNYGAPGRLASLPSNAALRLGLSATPDRFRDAAGTKALRSYFGDIVFRYSLEQAIGDGVLTPYRYYPETALLDSDELSEYLEITAMLARYSYTEADEERNEAAKRLLIRRARILASAKSKVPLLRTLLSGRRKDTHILVYCGDGTVTGPSGETVARQVDEAVRTIGIDLGMRCAPYTAETPAAERRSLLRAFESGDVQVLVAIRCLDEGVDVPVARSGYILASSTNPRQFVQRRGRLLRRAPGKPRADITDVFAVPDVSSLVKGSPEWNAARGILGNQISRAAEFASLAENGPAARSRLLDLCDTLDLLSYWGRDEQ